MDNTIGFVNTYPLIVIYPVDSAIHLLNNRDLKFIPKVFVLFCSVESFLSNLAIHVHVQCVVAFGSIINILCQLGRQDVDISGH